ncbi:kelch-like protein 9 isoform X2 [Lethenteron reissneri]|uniref:kelch-like protein 9 isoform X2 n=1 Tax=Lethenteron reissneri TaxID=7753 RepID=UPI002AB6D32E|nr:kelch-like protein 9 isoform X2 [Lethenteron reissneri]
MSLIDSGEGESLLTMSLASEPGVVSRGQTGKPPGGPIPSCPPSGTKLFTSTVHCTAVLEGFERLRQDGLLCDVSLLPGDGEESFPVHRAMMASSSDYFKAMFTGGMKEQDLTQIKLHGVSGMGLRQIIDFVYTAKLSLSMESLHETLEAASFLQVLPVLDFCTEFLISETTLENCVEVGRIANTYHLAAVDRFVDGFILRNFGALSQTAGFLRLPAERLERALASDSLKRCTELQLFRATCRWLRHSEAADTGDATVVPAGSSGTGAAGGAGGGAGGSGGNGSSGGGSSGGGSSGGCSGSGAFGVGSGTGSLARHRASSSDTLPRQKTDVDSSSTMSRCKGDGEPHGSRMRQASRLMSRIRFPLMSPQELLHEVQTVEFMRSDAACVNLLLEASNYQMLPPMQPVLQSERTRIRSDATHLLALGGVLRQQLLVSKELRLYDERTRLWRCLAPMEAPRYQHGIAVVGNFLFVVGGQSNYDTKGKTAVDTVFRYDPRYNRWAQVAPLNEKRTFFHLSALNGRLYAVGGRNAAGELATVECYDPSSNEWTYVARMAEPHYGHAGTVYGNLMYISGGITHDTFQKELLCYDPESDRWTQRAPMSTVRGLHCMCTVRDRLYVIGGNHFRGASDYADVLSCEFYSPAADNWTSAAPMLRGQSDVGVAVFQGRIYVVGGYSWNSRCMVEMVQRYDPERDEWQKVFDLPESLGGIRACTLTVHPPPDDDAQHPDDDDRGGGGGGGGGSGGGGGGGGGGSGSGGSGGSIGGGSISGGNSSAGAGGTGAGMGDPLNTP